MNEGVIVKRSLVYIVISMTLIAVTFVDASAESATDRDHSLAAGSWALQFQLEDDIGLKPYNGMTISLKKHLSAQSAFRMGARLDLGSADIRGNRSNTFADSLISTQQNDDSSSNYDTRLELLYVRYPSPGRAVNWFWGVGPVIGYSRNTRSGSSTRQDPSRTIQYNSENNTTVWRAGAAGAFGAEWFATRSFSLHAEYRASLTRFWQDSDAMSRRSVTDGSLSTVSQSSSSTDGWEFDALTVLLGLSVYF
jgi:hypothetical protein